jgi:hypothetical protein
MSKASRIARQLLEADEPFVSEVKDRRRLFSNDANKDITWATVTWRADVEYRSWGIKSIDAFVDRVELTLVDAEGEPLETEVLTTEGGWDLKVAYAHGEERIRTFYPFQVDVDWANQTVFVEF